uniref:Rho-GAP domain-containing protein n=2 Tax=Macrostomum lignano TaxID=282301 RepID=A0A1I8I667_9PLAT
MSTPTTEKSAPTPRTRPQAAAGGGSAVSRMTQLLETRAGGASAIIELDEAGQGGESPDAGGSQTPAKPRPAPRKQQSEGAKQQQGSKHTSLHHTVAGGSSMDSGFLRQLENSIKTQRGPEIPATSSATLPPGLPGWRVEEGGSGEPRKFLFGEPSMNMGFLAQGQQSQALLSQQPSSSAKSAAVIAELERSAEPAAPAQTPESQQPQRPKLEISLPVGGRLQETRKESPVKALRLPTAGAGGKESKKSSAKSPSGKRQAYHLVLTGPDLLFYRSRSDKRPELALAVAAVEVDPSGGPPAPPPLPSDDPSTGPLRLRYVAGGGGVGGDSAGYDSSSLGRQADLYPSADCDMLLYWDEPGARKQWSLALEYAKDLATKRMYQPSSQQQQTPQQSASSHSGWGKQQQQQQSQTPPQPKPRESKQRVSIAQRLNDFFRRRPALDELEKKGIVRNEPVFGSTLRQICAHERSDAPRFLSRCIEAIEGHGLETEGIYRLGGNAATVQKLRLLVDQTEDYDLTTGWDIFVLTSALKTFLRELREPLIPSATFQLITEHYQSSAKPSAKRESIRQVLRTLPPAHYNTLRLLFHHLTRVVQCSERNQMSSQNVALMMGPNLVWPASGDADGGLCLTSNLMFQNQVVEYILLETEFLFTD